MSSKYFIIDSSVAIKWYLPDEQDDNSLKLKSDFKQKKVEIAIPMLFFYEVSNVLRTTSKAVRIDRENAILAYQDLLRFNFSVYSSKELFEAALEKAFELDISSYDASYIALSEYLQIPFFTADKRLVQKAKNKFVLNLEDYTPPHI